MSARRSWMLAGAGVGLLGLAIGLFELTRDAEQKPPPSTATYDATPRQPVAADAIAEATIDAMIVLDVPADGSLDPPMTSPRARAERETLLAALRESGEGHEGWEGQANELLKSMADRDTQVSDIGCYIAGCSATFMFSSRDGYQQQIAAFQGSAAYAAWTGGKRWSPPETRPDGHVVVALVLYRPD